MPRLWMVDPSRMCRKHLLGEHHESHVFLGKLKHQHRLDGYIAANHFSIHDLWDRHEALVQELAVRGYRHVSPFPEPATIKFLGFYLPPHPPINRPAAEMELLSRGCDCC